MTAPPFPDAVTASPSHEVHPMRAALLSTALGIALSIAAGASAQTSANVTATCKDGSVFSGASRSGACRGHQGVATWDAPAATTSSPRRRRPRRHERHLWQRTRLASPVRSPPNPDRSGSTPPAKSITVPELAITARPSRVNTCRRWTQKPPGTTPAVESLAHSLKHSVVRTPTATTVRRQSSGGEVFGVAD